MRTESALDAIAELSIDRSEAKDLAWRLYLEQKIPTTNSIWAESAGRNFKGFRKFTANKERIRREEKERAEHPPKPAAQ